jgi:hypothetical protein
MENKLPKRKARKKVYEMQIDEADMESGVFAISLVEDPAIEENWVYMSKQKATNLAQISPDKRILVGPALIPNKLIPRIDEETGEEYDITFTPDVIERAAHLYMQRQNNNNATMEHQDEISDVSTVESWIITDPEKDKSNLYKMNYPKGTWMVAMKVNNPTIWNDYVKTGKIKGFSIEGMLGHELVKASKVELGYNTTGYDQQTQTRGLAVPPPTYGQPALQTPPPAGLPPNWGGPSTEDIYANLSNYDSIWLEKITELIVNEYTGDNEEEVLTKMKEMLEKAVEMTWAEFETSVSVGSSYAGQFGNAPEKKK